MRLFYAIASSPAKIAFPTTSVCSSSTMASVSGGRSVRLQSSQLPDLDFADFESLYRPAVPVLSSGPTTSLSGVQLPVRPLETIIRHFAHHANYIHSVTTYAMIRITLVSSSPPPSPHKHIILLTFDSTGPQDFLRQGLSPTQLR